jgi:hypothetical protein
MPLLPRRELLFATHPEIQVKVAQTLTGLESLIILGSELEEAQT